MNKCSCSLGVKLLKQMLKMLGIGIGALAGLCGVSVFRLEGRFRD